ncbi:MAG: preprotein translocase subunit SecA [Candidatus Gracilibacteria bacterium]|nr:preprotein translocase subunit SecA [Candidatus Gracilibacteria bacterium]
MIESIIKAIFGDPSEKKVKEISKLVEKIKEFEKAQEKFTLEDIQNKTAEFKKLFKGLNFRDLEDTKKIKEILNTIKCEAFALVKTAAKLINGKTFELKDGRSVTWNMIPYNVQLIGGLAIHEGNISEMKTGEGKTLVATLPAYLNALTGNSVHIVTVNDYLAARDSGEMGILYGTLGLTTGVVVNSQNKFDKKAAYSCDIVYATNNELGFDYLRDNMVISKDDKAQSRLFFAIIDEVDSILIDEARTPLIISMPDNEPTSKYMQFAALIKHLNNGIHYKIDEKQKTATLTEDGIKKIEELLRIENIYVSAHYNDIHHVENALKAMAVYHKDKDYLVLNGEVQIVDEHTGRVLAGRRYSEGLHQAIEAKEGVEIKQESKTLASITFQNYFRMYWKLAGMTGTAVTEAEEFYKVYGLDTLVIPTNKPIAREDRPDLLFKNEKGKFDYVVRLIKEMNATGQPILVGTVSVEKSEYLSERLKKEGIKHNVLNAKYHESEAEIVANAGQKSAITIATNMAGRGTDIKLGEGVADLGGLIILGTEKHETRRIDNQLRGRAGRQGDPGITQFLISPNDDIMRIFGGDKLFSVFNSPMFASLPDDEPLAQSGMLTKRVTGVQKQVEGHNFDVRKHILEYDDVINKHRNIIYSRRNKILDSENIHEDIRNMIENQISTLVTAEFSKNENSSKSSNKKIIGKVNEFLGIDALVDKIEIDDISGISNPEELSKYISNIAFEEFESLKRDAVSEENYLNLERRIVLSSIDELWMRHIDAMSKLREEVAFEGYAQKNPLTVYKEKAYYKFRDLINEIEYKVVKAIFSIKKIEQVEQIDLSKENFELNEVSIDETTKIKENINPLFNEKNSGNVKKIRV